MKADLYTRVTDQIIASLEKGVRPWMQPWSAANTTGRIVRPLRANGLPYQGVNVLMLWAEAVERGFNAPSWMTFKQAKELGGHVRKGERGSLVVYASKLIRSEENAETGEETTRQIPFLKGYTVFNVEQIDGLPDSFRTPAPPRLETVERIEHADRFVTGTGAIVRHGGNRAFYAQRADYIQMPGLQAFRDRESYYATLMHELTHYAGHPSRLGRTFGKRFADKAYAVEELVAEMGAAFLCADLDLTPQPREEHASYLAHWLDVLKADKRAIFTAASAAQRAADYLNNQQLVTEQVAA